MCKNIARRLRNLLVVAIVTAGLWSCRQNTETIWIISTNDMHGAIENFPNLATLVNEYRSQDTASVFLIDAGDRWTGNPYVDMAPEPGQPIIDLMNELGYDAATFGNHEFDKGPSHLGKRTAQAGFPVVLANMHVTTAPMPQPAPYVILQTGNGTRMAVVGLVTNFINGHPDGSDDVFEGLVFESPFDAADNYTWLQKDNDIMIALTHIGNDADSLLAFSVPDYDLIIGGHTHTVITEPYIIGKTYITQTGRGLRYAGITKLTMKGSKLESIENRLVKLDTIPPNLLYREKLEKYYDNEQLKKPVGSLSENADRNGVTNMLTDIVRVETKADFAFYHTGGIRIPELPAGPVSTGDLFAIDPFESCIIKVHMTLPEIRQMIINKFNDTGNPRESHREDIFPSGMNYTVVTDEKGNAVDVTFDHRHYPERGKLYTVALSDYIYKVYNFEKPEVIETSPLLTDMMAKYLGSYSPVKPDNKMRVYIRMR